VKKKEIPIKKIILDSFKKNIKKALEDERYTWRTVKGIQNSVVKPKIVKVRGTELSSIYSKARIPGHTATILRTLKELNDTGEVIVGEKKDGTKIFTTRKHYKKKNNVFIRMKDLAAGKVER
jgi:hypothetical protein